MAPTAHSTSAPAMQPGLPAFIVYDRIPEGCAAYPVTDNRQAPLLRAGDWVVADPSDRQPAVGELFMVRWQGGTRRPEVVETAPMPRKPHLWAVGARHRGTNADAIGWGDHGQLIGDTHWPADQLAERFLGRVVGILQTTHAEPAYIGGLN